jgi:hypothetical protein
VTGLPCVVTVSLALVGLPAAAAVTGSAGGSQPMSTLQPSLGIQYGIRVDGLFPAPNGSPVGTLGEILMFAGNFAPGGYLPADGRLMSISENEALFTLLGTTYGGDGQSTFALPDLRGRTPIGIGQGPGLTPRVAGEQLGVETVTLTQNNLPAHTHVLPTSPVTTTESTGLALPYTTMQPSLALNYIVPRQGIFPTQSGGGSIGSEPTLGFVYCTAIPDPSGWTTASGQTLSINQNTALFALLGTTYGGNGTTNFALPDMRGRAPLGVGSFSTGAFHVLGEKTGTETSTLTPFEMPAHAHTLPPAATSTGVSGGSQPQSTLQPSLALHHVIATGGIYPSRDGSGTIEEPLIGQIGLFAGTFAPSGWAFCDGGLLSIGQNSALFSILGTQYGGNGITTFALPDLDGSLAVGAGEAPGLMQWVNGQRVGSENMSLTQAELPAHTHAYVPEPAVLGIALLCAAAFPARRVKKKS